MSDASPLAVTPDPSNYNICYTYNGKSDPIVIINLSYNHCYIDQLLFASETGEGGGGYLGSDSLRVLPLRSKCSVN